MTEIAIQSNEMHHNDTALINNQPIPHGSNMTIQSNHSSVGSFEDVDDDDDTASSQGSADTVATDTIKNEKELPLPTTPPKRRNRALTVTQHNVQQQPQQAIVSSPIENPMADIKEQIHEFMEEGASISDSDSYLSNDDEQTTTRHKRNQSHRSTISSIHSYVSSASNYDLLLARLGGVNHDQIDTTKENGTTELAFDTPSEEIRKSFDRIHHDAVTKGEDEEIDWEFWSKVISDFSGVAKSEPKILSFHIQKGIPPTLRGMIWQLFAKSKNVQLEEQYMQLLKQEAVYEKAIIRDLPKATFNQHDYFVDGDGSDALFNVIKAYSLYDTEVGYSNGLLYITGPLLLNMPEEEAFCVLVQLMNKYNLRGHFLPQSDLLSQRLFQLEGLVADHLPHIQRHFEAHGIRSNVYAYQWFSTLFAFKFPLDTVYRIYDMIFAEGIETLYRFSIALLQKNQSTILSLEFDELINFLKNDLLEVYKNNSNQLVRDAFQVIIATKRLDRLAKDYQIESARANNEAEAIEALRRQNKALADSIRHLETEYGDLNKEHTEVATELITAKMDIARIHDENEALRQQTNDLKKALETLPAEVEARVKEEMEILYTKNAALVERNSALEDQLAYMENMIIEIKAKYTESENEREGLRQRLADLKRLMG
ncbi:GTPase-activating protein GYP5 [Choanephora cucurbitarum]|uniref:GTPase-activating protein GYP5 n=1 Tax=Choanephora cucurbitarum TaxID=101091 RepID=A0A1C7N3C4_9FUNG|nr:GTPase-activating protein GYP5 [Choanephora cucurbitarum]